MTATFRPKGKLAISMALMVVLPALAACKPTPSPMPTPFPTPTATPTPAEPDRIQLSPDVQIYLERMWPVASNVAIFTAQHKSSTELLIIVAEVKGVVPPQELEEAHAILVEGYELLAEGRIILEGAPRPELRSEAFFMQDWGIRQLREYRRLVAEYIQLQRSQATPSPAH